MKIKHLAVKKPKKKFLKLPEYLGGKEAFIQYVKQNLQYPTEALENRVEGVVMLNVEIDDNGNVVDVIVEKPIGFGCDEEAVRLLKNVQFSKVKNRGVRVKTWKKFKIRFQLPQSKRISYSITKQTEETSGNNTSETYSYQIKL